MSNKINNAHVKQPDKHLTDIRRVSFISTSCISQVFKSVTAGAAGQIWEAQVQTKSFLHALRRSWLQPAERGGATTETCSPAPSCRPQVYLHALLLTHTVRSSACVQISD